jgi:FKBP-type peptidyl-prolyl cis-trans isomerase
MKLTLFIPFLSLLFLFSCQSDQLDRRTSSGYHYILHQEGQGPSANPGDYVYYHARMRYQGKVRQDSRTIGSQPNYQIPLEEQSNQEAGSLVAVQEVLKELSVGDSVTVDIPVEQIPGNIRGFSPGDTVFYDIVITDIKTPEEYEAARRAVIQQRLERIRDLKGRAPQIASSLTEMAEKYRNNEIEEPLQSTPEGLQYLLEEEGTGSRADTGTYATVYYAGVIVQNGQVFDNAFDKGSPYSFTVGQARAIKGWEIGLPKFRQGGKGYLFVPADLAYGAEGKGPIPPGADLIFYIELDEVIRLSFNPQVEVK